MPSLKLGEIWPLNVLILTTEKSALEILGSPPMLYIHFAASDHHYGLYAIRRTQGDSIIFDGKFSNHLLGLTEHWQAELASQMISAGMQEPQSYNIRHGKVPRQTGNWECGPLATEPCVRERSHKITLGCPREWL